jgi:hypothetical protein
MLPFGLSIGKAIALGVIVLGIILALSAVARGVYKAGWNARDRDFAEYKTKQAEKTVETIREVEKIVVEVETKYVDRIKTVKVKGDTIVKEVPVYVTKDDDAACELRVGFVRVHDAASRNQPAEPAAESDRAAGGIALSEATAVIADNYAKAYVWREQVLGWQEFWSRYGEAIKTAGCVPSNK